MGCPDLPSKMNDFIMLEFSENFAVLEFLEWFGVFLERIGEAEID